MNKQKVDEWGEPIHKELSVTDEHGNKLYGYSQRSLDENTAETKTNNRWQRVNTILNIIQTGILLWLIWKVIHYQVLTNILKIIGGTFGKC